MQLLHIKLKNGEDILAQREDSQLDENGVTISAPVSIHIDPMHGFFAKSWMILSDAQVFIVPNEEILFCSNASEKGISYYEEFVLKISRDHSDFPSIEDDNIDSLQELFETLLEAKSSKLH